MATHVQLSFVSGHGDVDSCNAKIVDGCYYSLTGGPFQTPHMGPKINQKMARSAASLLRISVGYIIEAEYC